MARLKTLSVFALISVSALASISAFAAPVKKCDELAAMPFGVDVKIESAKLVAATPNLREHCDIRGVIWPEAKLCAGHAQQFGGESPPPNLMEVKG
jgi:hypothetical protein